MRILVTGGAGFIGSHIVDAYVASGHTVSVIDNLSTGNRGYINPEASFYRMNIQDTCLEDVFAEFRPDVVNHHAAHINLRQSVENPIYDAENNIIGSLNLLQNASKYQVKKFIFASTGGAIYGETASLPVDETTTPLPLSPYGAGKLAIEHYIRIWQVVHDLDYTIFRYPNVYGPRQHPKGEAGVVAIFSLQILQGIRPTIFGDGSKTRDYLFISDLVRANLAALSLGSRETLNLGWGKEISDRTVFDTIRKVLDYRSEPGYSTPRPGEVNRIALDAKRARIVLDWEPVVSFIDGIEKSVRFYREKTEDHAENYG